MLYQRPIISLGTKSSQCDEQKPECSNCQKKHLRCCYISGTTPPADSDKVLSKQVPSSTLFSLSLDSITRDIQETLTREFGCVPNLLRNLNSTHPMSTVAFHNFVRCSTETIASPAIRHVMRTDMIRVSFAVSHAQSPSIPASPPQRPSKQKPRARI